MRSKFKVYPYKMGSKSAKALATALVVTRFREEGTYRPFRNHKLINWGNSKTPHWNSDIANWINAPWHVLHAGNKLTAFQLLSRDETINLPPWTTDIEVAKSYGTSVVCRTVLNGHSGRGIILAETRDQVVNAPLYTGYIKKKSEFRVHVVRDEVIDIQQKRKSSDFVGEVNTQIRNHQNGWVYCRENLEIPEDLKTQAIKSVRALGLDFGAVDLIYNQRQNKSYVLEVNCAPGLEGSTVEKYKEAFLRLL